MQINIFPISSLGNDVFLFYQLLRIFQDFLLAEICISFRGGIRYARVLARLTRRSYLIRKVTAGFHSVSLPVIWTRETRTWLFEVSYFDDRESTIKLFISGCVCSLRVHSNRKSIEYRRLRQIRLMFFFPCITQTNSAPLFLPTYGT